MRISIHAPHTGRDGEKLRELGPMAGISIHAPHTGRDLTCYGGVDLSTSFQSTRPIRGATLAAGVVLAVLGDFNPRAPYGARRPCSHRFGRGNCDFNPRAPYGARQTKSCIVLGNTCNFNPRAPYGARRPTWKVVFAYHLFQSTRPIRGATIVGLCAPVFH